MALKSRICEMLGIRYPILLAGMGGASVPALAAAAARSIASFLQARVASPQGSDSVRRKVENI